MGAEVRGGREEVIEGVVWGVRQSDKSHMTYAPFIRQCIKPRIPALTLVYEFQELWSEIMLLLVEDREGQPPSSAGRRCVCGGEGGEGGRASRPPVQAAGVCGGGGGGGKGGGQPPSCAGRRCV